MSLSDRVRAGVEAAPWVIEEIRKLEASRAQAHVICCNDAVVAVHLGTEEEAQAAIEPLARADFERDKWHWQDEARLGPKEHHENPYKYYRTRCYWHLHTVPVTT